MSMAMILLNVSHSHSVFTISLPNSGPYCQIVAQLFYLALTLFLRKLHFPNRSPGALIGKPRYWNTLYYSLISSGENSAFAHFAAAIAMAVATIEADEAVASSVFVQIMGTPLKILLVRVILVIFGHFASSDFKVWLR